MKKGIKKMMIKILNNVIGGKRSQKFHELLFGLSLRGLNYGNGGDFKESGELNVLKYINDKFNNEKSLIIFDVGGNVGNYSKALSDFFNSKATIHSFEPSLKTYEIFLETTKNIKQIIPNNFGFSDIENYQLLYTNKEGSGLASIYQRKLEHFGISMDKSEEIKLFTIDGYCQINHIDRIHFLKLDIEGHELKALNGAAQMINNKKIDVIQFEFGGCNIDSRTYFQDFFYLLKDNYRIYRILKDGLFEIQTYKEYYEIFITINYLAVKKE
ncbi:MAG: FkbM family methyltransferase [Lutibacter sp.]